MWSQGESSAGSSHLLDKFSARLEMTDKRNVIWFTGVGCIRLFRFAGHLLTNRYRRRRWRFENSRQARKTREDLTVSGQLIRERSRGLRNARLPGPHFGWELGVHSALIDLDAHL